MPEQVKEKKKKRSFFSRLLFALVALIVAGGVALGCLSPVLNPSTTWYATIFGILFLPLAAVGAVFFILALLRRSTMAVILLLVMIPAALLSPRAIKFKGPKPGEDDASGVKVMSYNLGLFANGKDLPSNRIAAADSVCSFLRRTGADIICLQEFYYPHNAELPLDKYLRKTFPSYHAEYYVLSGKYGVSGNVTLSRLPVKGKGKIDFAKSTNMALYTDIVFPNTTLRVYNCHLQSYNISLKKVPSDEKEVEATERQMKKGLSLRPEQVNLILKSRKECPYRSVVVGDFNDNPLSYTYSRLCSGLRDSFVTAGKGLGATFTDLWPLLRIDYILYPDDELKATSHKVLKQSYSDHYPVMAELCPKN